MSAFNFQAERSQADKKKTAYGDSGFARIKKRKKPLFFYIFRSDLPLRLIPARVGG
jgi:hypothetical protein